MLVGCIGGKGIEATVTSPALHLSSSQSPGPAAGGNGRWCLSVIQRKNFKNILLELMDRTGASSHARMKRLILIGAIIVGAVTVSQAGLSVSISFGIPLPPPPVVIRPPLPVCPPPVVVAPPVCPPRVVLPPVCPPSRVVMPCPPSPYRHEYRYEHRGHGRDHYRHHGNYRGGRGLRR